MVVNYVTISQKMKLADYRKRYYEIKKKIKISFFLAFIYIVNP